MLTQIWSATDIIFCHFRPFFALLPHYWPQKLKFGKNVKNTWRYYPFTHVYHKSRSYDVWFLRYKVQRTKFFWHDGPFFCPFTLLTTKKKTKFWKNKTPWDIIILHLCTTNDNHIMYGSWDIKCDRQYFLSFWASFCPFTSLTIQKSIFWKNEKNCWIYYYFTHEYHKSKSYDVWFLRYGAWQT